MEGFRELVFLLKNYSADEHIAVFDSASIKQFPFLANESKENGKAGLVHAKGKFNESVAQDGFSGFSANERQRLWNTLLFLDLTQEDTHDPQRVTYLCWQRLAVLKTLMAIGAIKSLREIAEAILLKAKKYELTAIIIETAAQLRQFSALHDGNMRSFEEYSDLIVQHERILQAEQAADDEYCAFLAWQHQNLDDPRLLADQARKACQRLEKFTGFCKTSAFILNYYYLKLQVEFLEANWAAVVQISDQARQLLHGKSVINPAKVSAFALSKALGWANLGHLDSALDALADAIAEEKIESPNWYRLQEMKITWLLHQANYSAALDLLKVLSLKHKNVAWSSTQKFLYSTVMLSLVEGGSLPVSNRVKGMLLTNSWPFWGLHLPELNAAEADVQAALLLLQLPYWVTAKEGRKVAWWLQQYLELNAASKPASLRAEALITTLLKIDAGQKLHSVVQNALDQLQLLPLDYSSPEAAFEILRIETVLRQLLK